jgi:hypothetical protein
MKAKLKTFNFRWLLLALVAVLSACNLPGGPSSPTPITGQVPVDLIATLTPQVNPTQIKLVTLTPIAAVPLSTPFTPGAPVWSVYDYTCELAVGGGTMTMNLGWTDHSSSEAGYHVYRDELVIATLAPNSTAYVDVAFVATGKTLDYSVEAFNTDWRGSTSTLTHGCQ